MGVATLALLILVGCGPSKGSRAHESEASGGLCCTAVGSTDVVYVVAKWVRPLGQHHWVRLG